MRSYDFTATEKQDLGLIVAELAELRAEVAILRRFIERINNSCTRLLRETLRDAQPKTSGTVLSFRHRERLNTGHQRAKERGTRFGRPPALAEAQKREALARRDNGETVSEVARVYGVSPSTISRLG